LGRVSFESGHVCRVALSPKGDAVAAINEVAESSGQSKETPRMLRVWALPSCEQRRCIRIQAELSFPAFSYSTDGRLFAVASNDHSEILLWHDSSTTFTHC